MSRLDRVLMVGTLLMLGLAILGPMLPVREGMQRGEPLGSVIGASAPAALTTARQWTAVLLLSPTCVYCTESMPLFRSIFADHHAFAVVVAGTEASDRLRDYSEGHEFKADRYVTLSEWALPVQITPAVLLVDPSGTIRQVWMGEPTANAKRAMITALSTVVKREGF